MKTLELGLLAALVLAAALLQAADTPQPTKIDMAQAAGPIFKSEGAAKEHGPDGPATDVGILSSTDERFVAGLFQAGASDMKFDAYPVDEFCYFISGSVRLTSADGTVLDVKAGDAVTLPKGWKGRWQTSGYSKYYVVYDSAPSQK